MTNERRKPREAVESHGGPWAPSACYVMNAIYQRWNRSGFFVTGDGTGRISQTGPDRSVYRYGGFFGF